MRVSSVFEPLFPYCSFYSWDTDALRITALRIAATVMANIKKTTDIGLSHIDIRFGF